MRSGVYFTCGLVLLSGCVQSNWQQAAVRSFSRNQVNAAAQKRVQIVEQMLDQEPTPARSAVPLLRAQSQDITNSAVSLTSSSAEKTPVISHDAKTLALIEKETREFSAGDRERAVAALKAIPSESVPAVLQLWKAGLISPLASPTSPVVTAQSKASDFESSIQLASHETSGANAGLGQSSPWGHNVTRSGPDVVQAVGETQPGAAPQMTRVNYPPMGFSSPFPETSTVHPPFESASAASTSRGLTVPPQWNPNQNTGNSANLGNPARPPEWSNAGAATAPRQAPQRFHSDPFESGTSRRVVTPPDWQDASPPKPAPQTGARVISTQPLANQPTLPQSDPAFGGPGFGAPPVTTQSRIEQTRYNSGSELHQAGEIPLAPGQALPGFEHSVPPLPPRNSRLPAGSPGRAPGGGGPPQSTAVPTVQTAGEALQFLVRATESEVSQLSPGTTATELQYYIERQVYLRLLYLMSGQQSSALRPIPNIPAADQEFWTQVLWGVQNYFDMPRIPDHAERAAQTISQFNTAMLRLKERAPLELKNATFCFKIDGYGEYHTYSKDEFAPGQRVLVYAEIGNFHSELSAEGIYRTRLKSTLEVYGADTNQEPVEVKVYPVTEDFCRNHRRDYFHSYVVDIPVRCTRGPHVLKLIIEDELSGKVGTYTVPFQVR